MKKLVSVLVALVLILSAMSAFAAEINWSDIEAQGAELVAQGEFVTLDEIAVKMWIANIFSAVELTEEDAEEGYIAYFTTEDEAYAISVVYVDVDGMSLEEYKEMLPEYGATEIEDVVVNGLPAIDFMLEETDTACIAFTTEAGYILEVSGAPKSDEGFASVLMYTMASIQAE